MVLTKEERRKLMMQNHWSKKSEEEKKEIRKRISKSMEKQIRDKFINLPTPPTRKYKKKKK